MHCSGWFPGIWILYGDVSELSVYSITYACRCSKTLAYKIQTTGNYPEESIQQNRYIMLKLIITLTQQTLMDGPSRGISLHTSSFRSPTMFAQTYCRWFIQSHMWYLQSPCVLNCHVLISSTIYCKGQRSWSYHYGLLNVNTVTHCLKKSHGIA